MTANDPIQAVEKTIQVLEAVGDRKGARVSDLAEELGSSKSTVHRHLTTLEQYGYVVRDGREYTVGLQSLRLAASALDAQRLYPIGKTVVNELAEESGESAAVAAPERGKAVYLHYSRTEQAVKTDARIGIRLYLHCTGTGKAILAHMSEEEVDAAIDEHGLPRKTANTITDRETLEAELEEVRRTGVAFDDEERLEGMRGVATPILNRETGDLFGAFTVAGPTRRVRGETFRETFPQLLRQAANMVEVTLTYE